MSTVQVVYVGGDPAGARPPEAGGAHFPPGQPVAVNEQVAAALLRRADFARAAPPAMPARGSAAAAHPGVETR